jgi:hypothetical protein
LYFAAIPPLACNARFLASPPNKREAREAQGSYQGAVLVVVGTTHGQSSEAIEEVVDLHEGRDIRHQHE